MVGYHPFSEKHNPAIATVPFDEETADKSLAYPTDEEGFYRFFTRSWNYYIATDEKYMEYVDVCTRELNKVFGENTIKDFVWPFGEQPNENVMQALIDYGFRSIRATGDLKDSTGFALPRDRMHWTYNAYDKNLLTVADTYEAFPDDGELKFFCFGVHSIDFERSGTWDDLREFCDRFGTRKDYYYAPVGDIFDYEDAVKALRITDTEVTNDSEIDLYITVDGKRRILCAHSSIALS